MMNKLKVNRAEAGMESWIYRWRLLVQGICIALVAYFAMTANDGSAEIVTDNLASSLAIVPLKKKAKRVKRGPPALRLEYFYLERPKLTLNLSYELTDESTTRDGVNSKDRISEFREGVEIYTKGWIYHPALLEFNLGFEPEWSQTHGEGNYQQNSSWSKFLHSYSLDVTLLPRKPYILHFYGKKYQNSFSATFVDRGDVEMNTYGADLILKYRFMPTTLGYSHLKSELSGLSNSTEERDDFRLFMGFPTEKSTTDLSVEYSDSERVSEGVVSGIRTSRSSLESTYFFDKNLPIKLISTLSYDSTSNWDENDVSYSFESSDLRYTEQLFWRHNKKMWTNYKFLFDDQETGYFQKQTTQFNAMLKHLLYENLSTTIKGDVARYDFSDSINDVYKGTVSFDYNRRIPWGMLNITTGVDASYTNRNSGGDWIWITNERHVMRSGGVVFLDNENVDSGSVRVTNTAGTIVYIENQDFTVEKVGTLVRIQRIFSGSISSGQVVLVSYRYTTSNAFDDIVFARWAGVDFFLWSTLRLSYDYHHRSQNVTDGNEPANLIDDTTHRAKIRVLWRWMDTGLSYEIFDSNLSSARTTWRFSETLAFNPLNRLGLNFSGYFGSTSLTDTDEKEDFAGLAANIRYNPVYWCSAGVEGYYDRATGDLQDASDTGIMSYLELYYGKWTTKLSYKYLDHDDQMNDVQRKEYNIMLKITRVLW